MALRRITDEIMFRLRELSGQEYVNRYAKKGGVVEGPAESPNESLRERRRPAELARDRAVAAGSR